MIEETESTVKIVEETEKEGEKDKAGRISGRSGRKRGNTDEE